MKPGRKPGTGSKQTEYPELTDAAWLRRMYVDERMSTEQIAEAIGFDVDRSSVRHALLNAGVRLRGMSESAYLRWHRSKGAVS